jgi:hypothetical protein
MRDEKEARAGKPSLPIRMATARYDFPVKGRHPLPLLLSSSFPTGTIDLIIPIDRLDLPFSYFPICFPPCHAHVGVVLAIDKQINNRRSDGRGRQLVSS